MYWYVLVCTVLYIQTYVAVCTGMYWYVLVCTDMYCYVLVCTGIPLTGVDTGFRGSHRDAAMLPPSAVHASMEDRDSHPCPEDEEFFECRPDAADMEEAKLVHGGCWA